ncbi:hypothetical protein [Chengkuizengella axinellae]|uniref:Uncharacterized protein n=1 Tax=Chengkuizengella axinellae TaxID=3064388 RepID=A0ABT9J7L4_9BACL|nr:hypothetical protein [Chengkuizengella sp. 2205SS18-9]MDP5276990.1 hypothetical protein [Chengkuizengella sp. 2205SS18-9]
MSDDKRHLIQFWKGLGLTVIFHLIAFALSVILISMVMPMFFIGVSQLLYMIPAIVYFSYKDKGIMQGLCVGAVVTFLLNAACFGLLMLSFN